MKMMTSIKRVCIPFFVGFPDGRPFLEILHQRHQYKSNLVKPTFDKSWFLADDSNDYLYTYKLPRSYNILLFCMLICCCLFACLLVCLFVCLFVWCLFFCLFACMLVFVCHISVVVCVRLVVDFAVSLRRIFVAGMLSICRWRFGSQSDSACARKVPPEFQDLPNQSQCPCRLYAFFSMYIFPGHYVHVQQFSLICFGYNEQT